MTPGRYVCGRCIFQMALEVSTKVPLVLFSFFICHCSIVCDLGEVHVKLSYEPDVQLLSLLPSSCSPRAQVSPLEGISSESNEELGLR